MKRREMLKIGGAALCSAATEAFGFSAEEPSPLLRVGMSDGASVALEQGGSGPSLLLVHGSGAFRKSWVRVAPLLQRRFRTYAMDRRGHGASTDGTTYSLGREADDIVEVIATLPQPVFVLGHSYGAIATLEALRLTGKVHRAVIYEPPIPVPGGIARTSPDAICSRLATGDNEATLLAFFKEYAQLPPQMIQGLERDPTWPDRVKLAPTLCRETTTVATYQFDPKRFAGIRTPTLFLLGSESSPQMAQSVRTVASALPHSQLHVLAGQQHDAMFTAPDLLTRQVTDFLL